MWLSTPTLSFTASSLQFGVQNVGTSSSGKTIQLSNAGNASLSLASIAASGDFSQTNTCGSTLKLKNSCSIQVTFTPTANGLRSGSLTFTDDGRPGTQSLPLTGWAGPADIVPSVSPDSVTVKAGSTAQYFLMVGSGGGFAGTVQVACSGAPSNATCTLLAQSVQVVANGTAKVQVTVSTTARSSAELFPVSFMTIHTRDKQPLAVPAFCIAFVCIWAGLARVSRPRRARLLPAFGLCLVFGRMRRQRLKRDWSPARYWHASRQVHHNPDHDQRKLDPLFDAHFGSPVRGGSVAFLMVPWRADDEEYS